MMFKNLERLKIYQNIIQLVSKFSRLIAVAMTTFQPTSVLSKPSLEWICAGN